MARSRRPEGGEDAIRDAIERAEEFSADSASGSRNEKLARKLLNDTGNGERLRARHGRDMIYVEEIGWLTWTGSHWSHRHGEIKARLFAQDTARRIFDEAAAIEEQDKSRAKALRSHAVDSGNSNKLENMLKVSQPHLARRIDELDADPYLLNCQNGTPRITARPRPRCAAAVAFAGRSDHDHFADRL